jgi:ATP-dependent Clp protease ATP-binding subunit ClpA
MKHWVTGVLILSGLISMGALAQEEVPPPPAPPKIKVTPLDGPPANPAFDPPPTPRAPAPRAPVTPPVGTNPGTAQTPPVASDPTAPKTPRVATPFVRDEWKLRVEKDADGVITGLMWRNQVTGDSVKALGDQAQEILSKVGSLAKLYTDDKYSHAVLTLPGLAEGGSGLNGSLLVLTAEATVEIPGTLEMVPKNLALAHDGFYFVYVRGKNVLVNFYSLDEKDPAKAVQLLTTENAQKVTDEDTTIKLSANGALVTKGGEAMTYRANGKKGTSGLLYTDLTPSNIDVIEGTYGSIDLTRAAKEGRLDPDEFEQDTLNRVLKNFKSNRQKVPLLWGEDGIDTRGAVELLAYKIAKDQLPEYKGWRVYEVQYTRFGTEMFVDLTMKKVVEFMRACDQKKVILYLPDAHSFVGLGTGTEASSKSNDAGLAMATFMKTGNVLAIASTLDGPDGVGRLRSSGGAFYANMMPMRLESPDAKTLAKTLRASADKRQDDFRVIISDKTLDQTMRFAAKFVGDVREPSRTKQILYNVAQANAPEGFEDPTTTPVEITDDMVLNYLSEVTGRKTIALARNSEAGFTKLIKSRENFTARMHSEMVAQEPALEATRKALVRTLHGGSHRDGKGAEQGVEILLFMGPSGVGKSFTPEVLERVLNAPDIALSWNRLIIEGTTLQSEHSDASIGGSRPGYVGFKEGGGLLYSFVKDNPQGMVVFEEIDKIHENVMLWLYPFIERGRATDHNSGKIANFTRGLIFMTSNYGSIKGAKLHDKGGQTYADTKSNDMIDRWDRHFIFGVKDPEFTAWGYDEEYDKADEAGRKEIYEKAEERLKTELLSKLQSFKVLNPQIVGRIGPTNIVLFHHFNKKEITQVRDLLLKKCDIPYQEHEFKLEFGPALKDWLVETSWGQDGAQTFQMGARVMEKLIDTEIHTGIAQFILDNEDKYNGYTLQVEREGKELKITPKAETK